MLRRETVESHTLELLKNIQDDPFFQNTRLVGGTSLALQYGHRLSIDLDFFGDFIADLDAVKSILSKFGNLVYRYNTRSIFAFVINDIKVDLVNYKYPWIDEEITLEGIRLASDKDVAAMKLNAIAGRGSKKDFIDLFWLLKKYSIGEMLSFYNAKYEDGNQFAVLKSLNYFQDAEKQKVDMLVDVSWREVKNTIDNHYNNFIKSLEN